MNRYRVGLEGDVWTVWVEGSTVAMSNHNSRDEAVKARERYIAFDRKRV